MGEEREIIAHPAPVSLRAVLDQAVLLGRVRGLVPDPTILNEATPFFWSAEISSTRLDSYFTRMSEKTLQNYVEDANNGVSFQNSHRTNELGLGRSLAAEFVGPQGNGVARVDVTFYTLSGLRLNDVSTDDFIRGVRGGIIRDVSVGFYGGRYICNICGRDMLKDWECSHIPGMKYDRVDPMTGRSQEDQLCFAWVDDARLAEVSAVYEGSTPGAAIQKAVREASAGRITPMARTVIEQRYRCALPQKQTLFVVPGNGLIVPNSGETRQVNGSQASLESPVPATESDVSDVVVESPSNQVATLTETVETAQTLSVEDETETTPTDTMTEGDSTEMQVENETPVQPEAVAEEETQTVVETPEENGETMSAEVKNTEVNEETTRSLGELATIRTLVTTPNVAEGVRGLVERNTTLETETRNLTTRVNELTEENGRLALLADMGKAYRAELIEDALKEGTRADGSRFPVETYRILLDNASIDHIKALRDGFRARGDDELAGGRRTVENAPELEEETPIATRGKTVPAEAYRT